MLPAESVATIAWLPAVAVGIVKVALNAPEASVATAFCVSAVVPSSISVTVELAWNPAPVAVTRLPLGPVEGLRLSVGVAVVLEVSLN